MSKLDELIAELCPNGVNYKTLGEISSIITKQTGFDYTNRIKDSLEREKNDNNIPYIQTKFFAHKEFSFNTDFYIPNSVVNDFPKITLDEKCILFSIVGASIGNVGLFPGKPKSFLGGAICVVKVLPNYSIDYVYYCVESKYVQNQIKRKIKGAGQATITVEDIRNFKLPVPPLEVQREIVRVLDNFTFLTAELTAELTARRKQYQFYLDSFYGASIEGIKNLGSSGGYKLVPLGKLGTLTRGKRFVHADATKSGVQCIHYGELYTHYGVAADKAKSFISPELAKKLRFAHKGDVIIVGAGENKDDIGVGVAWFGNEDVVVHDACYTFRHEQNPKYISFFLRTNMYHQQIKKYVSEGKICAISADGIGRTLIPIPSIDTQEKIVTILDKFYNLCNDISKGLPAEIEARKKQYEYYRDKLLTFKELNA